MGSLTEQINRINENFTAPKISTGAIMYKGAALEKDILNMKPEVGVMYHGIDTNEEYLYNGTNWETIGTVSKEKPDNTKKIVYNHTHCRCCGAPYSPERENCEYCGSLYT